MDKRKEAAGLWCWSHFQGAGAAQAATDSRRREKEQLGSRCAALDDPAVAIVFEVLEAAIKNYPQMESHPE